jgi:hypothetical protein
VVTANNTGRKAKISSKRSVRTVFKNAPPKTLIRGAILAADISGNPDKQRTTDAQELALRPASPRRLWPELLLRYLRGPRLSYLADLVAVQADPSARITMGNMVVTMLIILIILKTSQSPQS